MPIKGLTDQARAMFPVVGKLRKGEPHVQGKPLKDMDHFRFVEEREGVAAAFTKTYGQDPQLVNVLLPYRTVEQNFSCWKEEWGQSGMKHRCDGETCVVWLDEAGNYQRVAKPCPGGCKAVGRLSVWIPEILAGGFIGTVTVETHSKNDILNLQGALQRAADMRGDHPDGLLGIAWVLSRRPVMVSTPMGGGKRARTKKWLLFLEPSVQWVRNQIQGTCQVAMLPATVSTETTAARGPEPEEAEFDEVDPETGEVVTKAESAEPEPASEAPKSAAPPPGSIEWFFGECKALGIESPTAIEGMLNVRSGQLETWLKTQAVMESALAAIAKLKGKDWPPAPVLA